MSNLLAFEETLAGKRIFVTGDSGFTGGWACLWLKTIDAKVAGFSLPPNTTPSLFECLNSSENTTTIFGDIRNYDQLYRAINSFEPELILHLAAQPLVRRSYREPIETFSTNVIGTTHVLEAARATKSVRAVLCITTDKVYKNNEWEWSYRENDPLGGKDPYSASKAAAEMVIQSYMASYPWSGGMGPAIAIARGGNLIGGGDWSEERLVPDFVRAVVADTAMTLRYPNAIRPWQHVLAVVQGYMMVMAGLVSENPEHYSRAWNLGPQDPKQYSVRDVLELISGQWRRPNLEFMDYPLPEASALALDSSLARNKLGWVPAWETERSIKETAIWYRAFYENPSSAIETTLSQIDEWRETARGISV